MADGRLPDQHPLDGVALPDGAFPFGDPEWFRDLDGTEDQCRAYLETLRWPDGVRCPRCESSDTARLEARKKFYCRSCRYHFSVTSGTLFHNSHLPTWKWFLTISLMIQSEDGLPANQLVDLLGVTYKTAWFAEHRVRAALQGGRDSRSARPRRRLRSRRVAVEPRSCRRRPGPDEERRACPRLRAAARRALPAARAEVPARVHGRDAWRSESRENPYAFRDTVLRLLGGDPLAYSQLVVGPRVSGDAHRPSCTRTDTHAASAASA